MENHVIRTAVLTLLSFFLMIPAVVSANELSGEYTIGDGDTDYATLDEAFDDLMGNGNDGDVTFLITSDIEQEDNVALGFDPGENNTITIKPAENTEPTITFSSSETNETFVAALILGLADKDGGSEDLTFTRNIVIDGSNSENGTSRDLTMETSEGANGSNAFRIIGDTDNIVLKNTNFVMNQTENAWNALRITTRDEAVHENILIENNYIENLEATSARSIVIDDILSPPNPPDVTIRDNDLLASRYGIWLRESAGNTEITGNTIELQHTAGFFAYGILVDDMVNADDVVTIHDNTIHNSTSNNTMVGLQFDDKAVYDVQRNTLQNLVSEDGRTRGIRIRTGGSYTINDNQLLDFDGSEGIRGIAFANDINEDHDVLIANNFITGFSSDGDGESIHAVIIRSPDGATADVDMYHNTIWMNPLDVTGSGWDYRGLTVFSSSDINLDLKNNIFINDDDNGTAVESYAYYQAFSAFANLTSDYNLWHGSNLSAEDDTYLSLHEDDNEATTLEEHQNHTGQDANSVFKSVQFVDATGGNLRLTGESDGDSDLAGAPLAEVTTDIDGQERNSDRPYMGAWEGQTLSPTVVVDGDAGWRMMAAPTDDMAVEDLEDQTGIQGIDGADYGTEFDPNIFNDFDGADWNAPTHVSDQLEGGEGFILYFFDNDDHGSSELPVTLEAQGQVPNTDVSTDLHEVNDGWNLIGNPYEDDLDVSDITDWANDGDLASNAVYVWDNSTESYVDANDNGEGKVAAWQGFFIQNDDAEELNIPESARTDGADFMREEEQLRRIAFELTGDIEQRDKPVKDRAISLVFHEEAGAGWDIWDAAKLTPLSARYTTLSFKGEFQGEDILKGRESRNFDPEGELELPMYISGQHVKGEFTVEWPELQNIPSDWVITLTDNQEDVAVDLQQENSYTFSYKSDDEENHRAMSVSEASETEQRFTLTVQPGEVTSAEEAVSDLPEEVKLNQNYPNPFNPVTTISFALPERSDVKLSVYDVTGRQVATLVNEERSAGMHEISWDASNVASGTYMYRLEADGQVQTKTMTLIK